MLIFFSDDVRGCRNQGADNGVSKRWHVVTVRRGYPFIIGSLGTLPDKARCNMSHVARSSLSRNKYRSVNNISTKEQFVDLVNDTNISQLFEYVAAQAEVECKPYVGAHFVKDYAH